MAHSTLTRRAFTALVCAGLLAPFAALRGIAQEDKSVSTNYSIGKMENGSLVTLGSISFDENAVPTLTVDATGQAAAELSSAFEHATAQDVLRIKRSRRVKNDDGTVSNQLIGAKIEKGADRYPQGLIDYMSNEYGYMARPLR